MQDADVIGSTMGRLNFMIGLDNLDSFSIHLSAR
jgi:hypothetical protein